MAEVMLTEGEKKADVVVGWWRGKREKKKQSQGKELRQLIQNKRKLNDREAQ